MNDTQPLLAEAEGESGEISALDLLQSIAENLRLLIIGPILAGLVALGLTFLIRPTYMAATTFLPPQQQQSAAVAMLQSIGALSGVAGAASGIRNPTDQLIALINSRSIRDVLIDRFSLMERYELDLRVDARKKLDKFTRISSGRSGLISVEVEDHDPEVAAQLANAYVEELAKLMGRLALTEAQARRIFFEEQLNRAKEGLNAAEIELKKTGIGEAAIKSSPGATVAAVAALMAQVAAKEVQLGSMRGFLTENAPEFKKAQSELASLRQQLARAEKDSVPGDGGDYVGKYRNYKYFETLFELLAKQFEIARIDESRESAVVQIVDRALPPERKSKPRRAMIASVTAIGAGIILLLFIFLRRWLMDARSMPATAEKLVRLTASFRRSLGRS